MKWFRALLVVVVVALCHFVSSVDALRLELKPGEEQCIIHTVYTRKDISMLHLKYNPAVEHPSFVLAVQIHSVDHEGKTVSEVHTIAASDAQHVKILKLPAWDPYSKAHYEKAKALGHDVSTVTVHPEEAVEFFVGQHNVCFFAPRIPFFGGTGAGAAAAASVKFFFDSTSHYIADSLPEGLRHPHEDDIFTDLEQEYEEAHATTPADGSGTPSTVTTVADPNDPLIEKRAAAKLHRLRERGEHKIIAQHLSAVKHKMDEAQHLVREVTATTQMLVAKQKRARETSEDTFDRIWGYSVVTMLSMWVGGIVMNKSIQNQIRRQKLRQQGRAS